MSGKIIVDNIRGPKGDTGVKGDTGTQGIQGVKGDTGTQGVVGSTGAQGITGAKGDTGLRGLQGIQGEQGLTGAVGLTGAKGDTGASGARISGPADVLRSMMHPFSKDPLPSGVLAAAGITLTATAPTNATFDNYQYATQDLWNDFKTFNWWTGTPSEVSAGSPGAGCVTHNTGAVNLQVQTAASVFSGKHINYYLYSYGKTAITVYIDNHKAFVGYTPDGTSLAYLDIPFAAYGSHEIVVNFGFAIVVSATRLPTERLIRAADRFTLGLFGDSYTDIGQSPDNGGLNLALMENTGWAIKGLGQGSTGWAAQNDTTSNVGKEPYEGVTRKAAIKAAKVDLLLAIGSVNSGGVNPADITTAATTFLNGILEVPVILAGPEHLNWNESNSNVKAQDDALRAVSVAFASKNVLKYIEWWTERWQYGGGNVTTPQGDGNQDMIIGVDTIHPNLQGNELFGFLFAAAMATVKYRVPVVS